MSLEADLEAHGLYLLGVARLSAGEAETYAIPEAFPCVALVGNVGSSYWPYFSRSAEFGDGRADPLDRWSRRIAGEISAAHPVRPVFPFEGPPYYPFQRWAQRAEGLSASPLGILIHPRHGLWHSYRFALLCRLEPGQPLDEFPCRECAAKPCLHACPVDAVTAGGYDVQRCAGYLLEHPDAACHQAGCLARNACPVAPERQYIGEQHRFHLRAFLGNRR